MTSSSDSHRVRVAAFFSGASDSPSSEVHKSLLEFARHLHTDVTTFSLPKQKLNACDGCYAGGGRTCHLPCDYNDIDSSIYDPEDKGVILLEKVTECDLLLLTAEARGGGLDCVAQKFTERLAPYENLQRKGQNLLDGKTALIAVVGEGAESVLGQVVSRLSALGFAIAPHGAVALELPRVSRSSGMKIITQSNHAAALLQSAVENSTRTARKLRQA